MPRAITLLCLTLYLASALPLRAADNSVVWLTETNDPKQDSHGGLLGRELFRQSFLIAARDGLGLQTRDQSLREWRGDPPPEQTIECAFQNNHLTVRLLGAHPAVIYQRRLPSQWCRALTDMLDHIENQSRGEFVTALRNHGYSGRASAVNPGEPAPAGAEEMLGAFNELSQFSALRITHQAISTDGESPQRLGILVRAYANLGILTRFHWDTDYDVYVARSILYAQRMVAADPKSAVALWHRAYAFAFAGLNAAALA